MAESATVAVNTSALSSRRLFIGAKEAVTRVYGTAALEAVMAKLSPECRLLSQELPNMIPQRHLEEILHVVHDVPAKRSFESFDTFLDVMTETGFNRFAKVLSKLVSPDRALSRASELYQRDHTQGTLQVKATAEGADVSYRNYPFHPDPVMCFTAERMLAWALSRCRVDRVTSSHYLGLDRTLVVKLGWKR